MDLIEIDAASHTGVDDARSARQDRLCAQRGPLQRSHIIDEVHRFSGAAFDALLKTLEEPPPHAIFVLATTEIAKVPATIRAAASNSSFARVVGGSDSSLLQEICDEEGVSIDRAAGIDRARGNRQRA